MKYISAATISGYASAGLVLKDLDGQQVTLPGWYDFTAREPGGDGAKFVDLDGNGKVDFVTLVFTDNKFGDADVAINRITDPGTLARVGGTPGITVVPASLSTSESGTSASFTVVLDSQPSSNVTLSVTSGDTSEGLVSRSSLLFTRVNWNVPQSVTVTGQNDALADGNITYFVNLQATSTDTSYSGLTARVSVTNFDVPPAPPPVPPTLPTLSIANVTASEAEGVATLMVTRTGNLGISSSVSYQTQDRTALAGLDYTETSGTLNFASGVTALPINVPIIRDTITESTETFVLVLSSPINATVANGSAVVSILNSDNGGSPAPPAPIPTLGKWQVAFMIVALLMLVHYPKRLTGGKRRNSH